MIPRASGEDPGISLAAPFSFTHNPMEEIMDSQPTLPSGAPAGSAAREDLVTDSSANRALTIPEKVICFITQNMPKAYCDDCLAEVLQLRRAQVNTVTCTLGFCREYSRGIQVCHSCSKAGKSAIRRENL